jgi:hypothetical protein
VSQPGTSAKLRDPEPWPEPVDGAELLTGIGGPQELDTG